MCSSDLYGTMAFLVINTVVHYYTVGHMTALTALKQLPSEIEATAASVNLPQYKLFFKVTVPVCLPAILDCKRINNVSTANLLISKFYTGA